MSAPDFDLFINRVRSLFNIDGYLLLELTGEQQREFVRDPVRYFINTDAEQSAAVFREVEKRQRHPAKPFSTYPEDREKMLALCADVEKWPTTAERFDLAALELADLVKAILTDEAVQS